MFEAHQQIHKFSILKNIMQINHIIRIWASSDKLSYGRLIRFSNCICRCHMRDKVKISKLDDNPNKLYLTRMNNPKCANFKWWTLKRDTLIVGSFCFFIDSRIINIIDNTKEVKSIVKKLQKFGHFEGAVNTIMYYNIVLLAVNDIMLCICNSCPRKKKCLYILQILQHFAAVSSMY